MQGSGGSASHSPTALYRSVGEELHHFDVDVDAASLTPRGTVRVPAGVQYVWPHPSRQYLYAASSNRGPGATSTTGETHHLTAFRVDAATGALHAHGEPVPLPWRAIHMSLDRTGNFALTAYNLPSTVSVHRINGDGTIGALVQQPAPLDTGIYAHQILATPDNRAVILVTRGNDPAGSKAEDPGALKVFRFHDGVLSNLASVAPGGGYGFGPRHLDFHPTQPWVYVARERENKLDVYRLDGERLSATPLFVRDTLGKPRTSPGRQAVGTVHVHPSGRFVYVANRASATVPFEGQPVFQGGENTVAVYAIDQGSGEPTIDSKRRVAWLSCAHVCPRPERPLAGGGHHRTDQGARGIPHRQRPGVPLPVSRGRRQAGFRAKVRCRDQRQVPVVDGDDGTARPRLIVGGINDE